MRYGINDRFIALLIRMDTLPWSVTGLLLYLSREGHTATFSDKGERTWVYTTCMRNCLRGCDGTNPDMSLATQIKNSLLRTCWDQCPYICMWNTVHAYELDRSPTIPKFYGKWPYLHFCGMDKPVTCLVCAVNIIMHILLLKHFRRKVKSSIPMFYAWHAYSVISLNQWCWAVFLYYREHQIIQNFFHMSEFLVLLCSVWIAVVRLIGFQKFWKAALVTMVIVSWYIYHISWHLFLSPGQLKLSRVYDEQAYVIWGFFGKFLWIFLSIQRSQKTTYLWKLKLAITGRLLLSFLHGYDFPPYLWLVDVYTLVYAGFAVTEPLWYSYAIEDCHQLMKSEAQTKQE